MKHIAVILSAGSGNRFNSSIPKQYINLAGKNIIAYTIEAFELNKNIDEICVVADESYHEHIKDLVKKNGFKKVRKIIAGGKERKDSSFCAIKAYENESDAKLIFHDSVRPFVSQKIINDCAEALKNFDAVDVAIPTADTIIQINEQKTIEHIPVREFLQRGQTPQGFSLKTIKKAHLLANEDSQKPPFTDDCGLVKHYLDTEVFVVAGDEQNIKITYPEDLMFAEKLIQVKSVTLQKKEDFSALKDKVFMVFGGNSGIGKKIVALCEENGAKVKSFSRSNGCDITKPKQVKKAFEAMENDRIDGVFVCSGVLLKKAFVDFSHEEINEQININYLGSVLVAHEAHKYLKKSKGSLTLFTSSSYTKGRANYALYSSSKAATVNFAEALADEWLEDGVKVNVINPARTKTPMRVANFGKEDESTLLDAKDVAKEALRAYLEDFTGMVVDVKKGVCK